MKACRMFGLLLIFGLMLWPSSSSAQQARLTDDAFVSPIAPNNNFGASSFLNVGQGFRTFVKFDLSTLPAGTTGNNVAKATLWVYVSKVSTPGSVDLVRVISPWSESTVTFNSAPSMDGAQAIAVPVTVTNSFLTIDVTALVKDWLNGVIANNGVAFVANTNAPGTSIQFDSKESS